MEKSTSIGKLLTKARKKQKLSLDDIVQKTKINANVLKHLEEDRLDQLPNRTYVRGFVTNYAKTVGIDPDHAREVLGNTYAEQLGEVKQEPVQETITPQIPEPQPKAQNHDAEAEEIKETIISIAQSIINKKVVYTLATLLVVGIIGKGIATFFSQLSSESKSIASQQVEPKADNNIKPESANLFESETAKKIAIEMVNEEKKKEVKEKQDIVEVKEVKKEEPKKLEQKKPEIVKEKVAEVKKEEPKKEEKKLASVPQNLNGKFPFKKFYPTPKNMYDLVENAPEVSNAELLPPNIKSSVLPNKQNVYIVATEDNTWISYKVDDQKIKRYVLKKGRRVLIKGDQILLFMGNFNATKVFLNNKLVTANTKTGVKSMIFPEEDAKNFELPLFPSFNGVPYSAEEYKANMAQKTIE